VTSVVLDASALLALFNKEPGADVVRAALVGASISAVNYSETMKKVIERSIPTDPLKALIRGASLDIVPFDEAMAEASAALYPQTKMHGLSFADRACLALGVHRNLKVLTAERRMSLPTLSIKVKLIRHAN